MKFVSFQKKDKEYIGIFYEGKIYSLKESAAEIDLELPSTMNLFLQNSEENFIKSKIYIEKL